MFVIIIVGLFLLHYLAILLILILKLTNFEVLTKLLPSPSYMYSGFSGQGFNFLLILRGKEEKFVLKNYRIKKYIFERFLFSMAKYT